MVITINTKSVKALRSTCISKKNMKKNIYMFYCTLNWNRLMLIKMTGTEALNLWIIYRM